MKNEAVMKRVTDGVAAGGVTMPVWLPDLHSVSVLASELVPILSVLWLGVQAYFYVRNMLRKRGAK